MSSYNLTVDFSNLLMGINAINKQIDGQIQQAISMAAQKVYEEWADRVMKAPGIYMPERQAYVHSLKWESTGPYSARVWTDYKVADEIENGRPPRDLKEMLQTSNKTRQGKKGKYLIIPLRHNTPVNTAHAQAMPVGIHAVARQLQPSKVTGMGTRVSATGATVAQAQYQWGGRLPAGMAPKLKPHHTTDIYSGMVKMNTGTGKSKSSAYLAFRLMGEWQTGKWIVPAKPGLYIARQLATDMQSDVEKIVAGNVAPA